MCSLASSFIGEKSRAQPQVQFVVDEKSRAEDLALASGIRLLPLGRDLTWAGGRLI